VTEKTHGRGISLSLTPANWGSFTIQAPAT
jgi:hypothetical protein